VIGDSGRKTGFGRFLEAESALAVAPKGFGDQNVNLGKGKPRGFCTFFSVFDRYFRFLAIFERNFSGILRLQKVDLRELAET